MTEAFFNRLLVRGTGLLQDQEKSAPEPRGWPVLQRGRQ